jgi:transcriptional regulator with XRE-family HTH domain
LSSKGEDRAMKQVAEKLRALLIGRNVSQEALAFAADIDRTQISLLESGSRSPRLMTFLRQCEALGVSPIDVLDGISWEPGHFARGTFMVKDGASETP